MSNELAWAAGFFDGEGCVSRVKNKQGTAYLHVQVSQSETPPIKLSRFQHAVNGLGKIYGPHKMTNRRKPNFSWHTAGKDAFEVMELLRPYLCHSDKYQKFENLVAQGLVVDARKPKMCRRGLHLFEEHSIPWGKQGRQRICRPCLKERLEKKKRAARGEETA